MKTVSQAIRQAGRRKPTKARLTCFATDVIRRNGSVERGVWIGNLTTDTASGYTNRRDHQSKAMGMGPSFAFATAVGNATSIGATTLTNTGASFTTAGQALAGQIVVAGPNSSGTGSKVYGVIVSNTSTALTVDQWYDPASTSGAAGTTPNGTCSYVIVPGQNPASWLALTQDSGGPTTADTTLTSELAANGFTRAVGTYAHTAAATTYTLTHLFTASGTDTINKMAVFGACNTTGGGVMPFESAMPNPPTLVSGDTLNVTETVTVG